MKIEIDQSHKIEQTAHDTIIALSNDIKFAIMIKSKEKRTLQEEFRKRNQPRNFVYFTFAALIVLLLQHIDPHHKITIDTEYLGHNAAIADRITAYSNKQILFEFGFVGKRSPAHILAAQVATAKRKPNKLIYAKEVLKIVFPIKKDRASLKGPRIA